jgi:hypothetical protein
MVLQRFRFASPVESAAHALAGNPIDWNILAGLMVAGVFVLRGRGGEV